MAVQMQQPANGFQLPPQFAAYAQQLQENPQVQSLMHNPGAAFQQLQQNQQLQSFIPQAQQQISSFMHQKPAAQQLPGMIGGFFGMTNQQKAAKSVEIVNGLKGALSDPGFNALSPNSKAAVQNALAHASDLLNHHAEQHRA